MALTRAILNGVTLPYLSDYERKPEPITDTRELSSGTLARYHRGFRHTFTLGWSLMKADAEATLEQLGRIRGETQFVDIDGTPFVVLVEELDGIKPIPGTAPEKYKVGITLRERRPR